MSIEAGEVQSKLLSAPPTGQYSIGANSLRRLIFSALKFWNRWLVAVRRIENPLGRGWKLGQLACWPARPDLQLTATVGANPVQLLVSTGAAKRAFKGANARVNRRIGQVCVAAFAIRAELKHGVCCLLSFMVKNASGPGD